MEQKEFEKYIDNYTLVNKLHRLLWKVCCLLFFRPFGLPIFKKWRIFVLRCFGAKIGKGSLVHSTAVIWSPWNLEIGQRSCIGPHTRIYNPGKIILGNKVVVSQYSYLCTATHDYKSNLNTLFWKDIILEDYVWVAAEAFIGPGVTIGEGAIIGARSVVFKNIEPWIIVVGNPAFKLKNRVMNENDIISLK